jgi:hypothetical protein
MNKKAPGKVISLSGCGNIQVIKEKNPDRYIAKNPKPSAWLGFSYRDHI